MGSCSVVRAAVKLNDVAPGMLVLWSCCSFHNGKPRYAAETMHVIISIVMGEFSARACTWNFSIGATSRILLLPDDMIEVVA